MGKILVFSGSIRTGSVNTALAKVAAQIAEQKGADVTLIDLASYPMPIYNGDLEESQGQPEQAKALHNLIASHDGMIITSPEYNGLPSALLKNTIDWVSRVDVKVFAGKAAGLLSASPGALGGLRGLPHVRTLLTNINVLVVPQQAAIGGALDAFDDVGNLKDDRHQAMVSSVVDAVLGCV